VSDFLDDYEFEVTITQSQYEDMARIKVNPDPLDDDEFVLRAKELYRIHPFFYDKDVGFYLYDVKSASYVIKSEDELISHFLSNLDSAVKSKITMAAYRSRLLYGLKLVGMTHKPMFAPPHLIKFKDMVIDFKNKKMYTPSPAFFFLNSINAKLGDSEDTPYIDSLFESWVGKDKKHLLYEIIAYSMLRDYPIHRIFLLHGSGRNGKSSFLKLLFNFIGKENIISTDLERLEGSRFETARLYGKLVAMCGETNFSMLEKSATLKSLSGQDEVTAEFKFRNPFTFRNYAKIIIATNSIPMSLDTSDGFFSRIIIVDFPNLFNKGKDVIVSIPPEEYNNLARKSLRVLVELLEQQQFTGEGDIAQKRKEYEARSNPLQLFMNEFTVIDHDGFISSTEFYQRFSSWSSKNRPRFRIPSWKEIKAILDSMGLETGVRKHIGDTQKRCIVGIKWKNSVLDYEPREEQILNEIETISKSEIHNKILEYTKDELKHISDIYVDIAVKYNLSDDDLDKTIKYLVDKGLLFEIKPNMYKSV